MGCASADIDAVAVGVFLKGDGIHCRARESLRNSLAVVCTVVKSQGTRFIPKAYEICPVVGWGFVLERVTFVRVRRFPAEMVLLHPTTC